MRHIEGKGIFEHVENAQIQIILRIHLVSFRLAPVTTDSIFILFILFHNPIT